MISITTTWYRRFQLFHVHRSAVPRPSYLSLGRPFRSPFHATNTIFRCYCYRNVKYNMQAGYVPRARPVGVSERIQFAWKEAIFMTKLCEANVSQKKKFAFILNLSSERGMNTTTAIIFRFPSITLGIAVKMELSLICAVFFLWRLIAAKPIPAICEFGKFLENISEWIIQIWSEIRWIQIKLGYNKTSESM